MTKNKDIVLTEKEQELFSKEKPELLKAIEQNSPVAHAWLASYRNRQDFTHHAEEQAEEIKKEVMIAPPEQANIAHWCGFPTDMTRCSPFFPMNPKELGQRDFLRDFIITSANWGEIKYTGGKLSTYEEDVLLAVLAVLNGQSQKRQLDYSKEENQEPKKTYTYKGSALPLLKILGHQKPSKREYTRLFGALKLLTATVLELIISSGKTKTGKKREPRRTHMSNMLSCADWNDVEKILTVTINPYFYEMYLSGQVTYLDVSQRMSLKGVITKALYRFIQSQQIGFTGHFLTLANALNMDIDQPQWKIKQHLKKAISELKKHSIITSKSGFTNDDIIKLILGQKRHSKNIMQGVEN